MIAQSLPAPRAPATDARAEEPLSPGELHRLTLFKWRYSLEAIGFAEDEVRHLLFVKWLHATRRVRP